MRFLRKAADQIAAVVVRYASPSSKQWAQALTSELIYIRSDARAFLWALSGMRVLLDTQPAPVSTNADLDIAAQKHAERRRHAMNNPWLARNAALVTASIGALQELTDIICRRNIVANALLLSGLLLLTPFLYLHTREPNVPDRDDRAGLIRFYVSELSANSRTSIACWMFLAGILTFFTGLERSPIFHWEKAALPLFPLAPMSLLLIKHRNNRRRLDQVAALLATTSPQ